MPTRQPSYFDKHPDVLKKQYTADEIATLKKNFEANPLKYSQAVGDMLLWRMHQKSPEFALEFAQTPEIADGINAPEAKAMDPIYGLIKGIDIPHGLFEKRIIDRYNLNILIEWESNSKEKSDWGCRFIPTDGFYRSGTTRIIGAKPIGFEMGKDRIDIDRDIGPTPQLSWQSQSNSGDTDGILITMTYPEDVVELSFYNGTTLCIKKKELLSKDTISFDENDGLEGKLNIKKVGYKTGFISELVVLNEMVLSGEGEHRYSSLLQALLWGYMDRKFKEKETPLENYQGTVEFVKPVWGEMEGERWEDFDAVTSRLNLPELVDYYTKNKFTYEFYLSHVGSAHAAFSGKGGNCVQIEAFQSYCLNKGGYSTRLLKVEARNSGSYWHTVTEFVNNGKRFIMDNGTRRPRGIIGPFNSLGETNYRLYVGR